MAVIKYKMIKNAMGRREVPGYVEDRGHWGAADGTYIGWANLDGTFYVDLNNAIALTRDEFIARGKEAGHTTQPEEWNVEMDGEWKKPDLGAWYDQFVSQHS